MTIISAVCLPVPVTSLLSASGNVPFVEPRMTQNAISKWHGMVHAHMGRPFISCFASDVYITAYYCGYVYTLTQCFSTFLSPRTSKMSEKILRTTKLCMAIFLNLCGITNIWDILCHL
jgi:hypothetical protein